MAQAVIRGLQQQRSRKAAGACVVAGDLSTAATPRSAMVIGLLESRRGATYFVYERHVHESHEEATD